MVRKSLKSFGICILTMILCFSLSSNIFASEVFDDNDSIDYIGDLFEDNKRKSLNFSEKQKIFEEEITFKIKKEKKLFASLYNDAMHSAGSNKQKNSSSKFYFNDYVLVTRYIFDNLEKFASEKNVIRLMFDLARNDNLRIGLFFDIERDYQKEVLVTLYNNSLSELLKLYEKILPENELLHQEDYEKTIQDSFWMEDLYPIVMYFKGEKDSGHITDYEIGINFIKEIAKYTLRWVRFFDV